MPGVLRLGRSRHVVKGGRAIYVTKTSQDLPLLPELFTSSKDAFYAPPIAPADLWDWQDSYIFRSWLAHARGKVHRPESLVNLASHFVGVRLSYSPANTQKLPIDIGDDIPHSAP